MRSVTTLASTTDLCKLLSDPTRLRLLLLLRREELTVAELVAATELPQPRVSTHLGRLKDAQLVADRRSGASAWYRLHPRAESNSIVKTLLAQASDPLTDRDAQRMTELVAARGGTWAEGVAGTMERHYSPGRTWESLAQGVIGLVQLGRVLDIGSGDGSVARLLANQAAHVTCLDASERVLDRGRPRKADNMTLVHGDMHALPFADHSFDQALLLTALVYAIDPARVLSEAYRVLVPGGRLVATVLRAHEHADAVAPYDHVHLGFTAEALTDLARGAGLTVRSCGVTSRERRAPHFEVLTLVGDRPLETP
ncbi:MAG: metalloregulator ArsR/SmtB family transcription factor [Proteobacteria bacterium]|nr:metalloregulator ArsR/SmtB family transcription factor [Pseudomonadota bacterium]MCP4919938.1 metalloregulator ArsR/SmtB family transcription factor [Pseudomonadota bacterium]